MFDVVLPLKEQAMLTTLLTQPHRYYHNINHINDLLIELDDWAPRAGYADNVKRLVTYGIWYHDAIYNTYSAPGSNERLSARLFEQQHPEFEPFELNCVVEMIEATAKHTSQQDMREGSKDRYIDIHNAVMLDCDLAGFGHSWEVYEMNGENIRQEYYKTSDADFYAGRYQFLMKMHQRMKLFGSIYYTRHFQARYDAQSKENIENDIIIIEDILEIPAEKSILTWKP
jgi:predicted metal-dependent HD superfamily phosphohydrolase